MSLAFKSWMIEHGITQKDVATAIDSTESAVSRKMRNCRGWRAVDIAKIMVAFNLTADQVVQFFLSMQFEK